MNYRYEFIEMSDKVPIRFFYTIDREYRQILQHWHDEVEIISMLTGKLEVRINNQTLLVHPGETVIINSNHIHTTHSIHPDTTAYVMQIPSSFLKKCSPDMARRQLLPLLTPSTEASDTAAYQNLCRRFDDLQKAYTTGGEHIHIRIQGLLYEVVYLLIHHFSCPPDDTSLEINSKQTLRLKEITNYIDEHYQEPLSLRELSQAMGMSYEYMSRFFKKNIGISFSNYLDLVRLEHAYQEVLYSDTPITYIADRCGFANYQMFQKKFKSYYGQNPLSFRKQYKDDAPELKEARLFPHW